MVVGSCPSVYAHCFHTAALYVSLTSLCGSILLSDLNTSARRPTSVSAMGREWSRELLPPRLRLFISEVFCQWQDPRWSILRNWFQSR